MTDEQCIELVEKVWGMTFAPGTDLEDDVNSWQGFGRTVEAMMDQGRSMRVEFVPNKLSPEIIEATHLAALEALESE